MIYKNYIKDSFQLNLFLDEVNDYSESLRAAISGTKYKDNGLVIYLTRKLSSEEDSALQGLVDNHDSNLYTYPRVFDHVEKEFLSYPVNKIDFTIHLKEGIVWEKSLYNKPNGRPDKAVYSYDGIPMAEISWTFYDASGGLFYQREQYLAYYNSNGTLGNKFLIKKKIINFTVPNQLAESINERVQARGSIVDEIKAVCSGALQVALQLSLEQVVNMIKPFWDSTRQDRENFIELASTDWMNYIATIDTSAEYTWLATPVDANGTTCKDYMLYRLGY